MTPTKKKKKGIKNRYAKPLKKFVDVLTSPAVIDVAIQLIRGLQAAGKKR